MAILGLRQPSIYRRPVNPLDKTTIVSIYTRDIKEEKPTLEPGSWHIPAAKANDFSLTVVGPSSWFKEMEEGQPHLEIQTNSIDIAQSIIRDYVSGLVASNGLDCMPGLFCIPGSYDKTSIQKWVNPLNPNETFKTKFDEAVTKQKNWYAELIKIADIDWARTQGNPLAVTDDARRASIELNMKDKPWLQDFKSVQLAPCKSCGELVNPDYPVCKNCHAIVNKERAIELGIVFAVNLGLPAGK